MSEEAVLLDERGSRCPMPVIALARATRAHPGALARLLASDPAAKHDVPAWCRMKGAELIGSESMDDGTVAYVVRLPAR